VNRVGYGAMQLAGPNVWGLPDDPESARRVLRLAVELGVTFFDTANAYGPRTVNRLIGEALRPFPEGVIVGNKVGAGRGPGRSWIITGHPDTVRRQVHEALADLGTEASELTYLRLSGDSPVPPSDVPLEDSLGALVELRDQGLIRRIGLSGASPAMLARAQTMTPIAAVQNRFNLLDRSGVQVLADCEAQNIMFERRRGRGRQAPDRRRGRPPDRPRRRVEGLPRPAAANGMTHFGIGPGSDREGQGGGQHRGHRGGRP
jgi:pyridoxine 4-dehydrogenase